MNILCVIPSRIGSTRLPRKPLLPIQGKPMIQWTYENAARCKHLTHLVVATDSQEIADCVESIGGNVLLSDEEFKTGTDRVASIAEKIPAADVVVNLQGDEPFIQAEMLEELLQPYLDGKNPEMATLAYPLNEESYENPGAVKVLIDKQGYAMYFSRAPIPYFRESVEAPVFHHLGLYAFQKDFLLKYRALPESRLEKAESLEQLRALENGHRIYVSITQHRSVEVNTPEEYESAQVFAKSLLRD